MPSEPAIDTALLLANAGGDAGLALDLLRTFRDALAAEAAGLDGKPDGAARAALAHKVKGAALVIGARGLALAAEEAGQGAAGGGYQAALAETCAAIDAMLAAGRFVPGEA
ncbi:MAG: Hpt domain-containing protein [Rhizobiales bacterium]|nr:Hpt domain-containing protein [Hyphomicrobiales bacterium]